jgi:SAM-dependent methyltransferase
MRDELFDEMFELETRHWWYQGRRRIVLTMLERELGAPTATSPRRVCDLGCGCGMILHDLAQRGYQVTGLDASAQGVSYCAARGLTVIQGVLPDDAAKLPGPFDIVMIRDVLEHIPDDRATLAAAAALVAPGGVLLLTVPAFQWLWSHHDDRFSHLRRYNSATLHRLVADLPGVKLEFMSYMNAALFPAACVSRLAMRLLHYRGKSVELKVPPAPLNGILEATFAAERHWLGRGLRFPFGLSLIAVLRA